MRGFQTNGFVSEDKIPAVRRQMGEKICPKCGAKNRCIEWTCKASGCGYAFRTTLRKSGAYSKKPKIASTIDKIIIPVIQSPAPVVTRSLDTLRAESIDTLTGALNTVFDNIAGAATTPDPKRFENSQHDTAISFILQGIQQLLEDNKQLRAELIYLKGQMNVLMDIHKDKIPQHKHEPILTNHVELLSPKRKSIVVIGLIGNQINEVRDTIGDRANVKFIDASKNTDMPNADYVIMTRHSNHSWETAARQKVGDKRYKRLDNTSAQGVINAALGFLSRQ